MGRTGKNYDFSSGYLWIKNQEQGAGFEPKTRDLYNIKSDSGIWQDRRVWEYDEKIGQLTGHTGV